MGFFMAEAGYEPIIDAVGPQQVQADGDGVNSKGGVGSAAGAWAAAAGAGGDTTAGVWAADQEITVMEVKGPVNIPVNLDGGDHCQGAAPESKPMEI
jgi:hypothetical protein